MTSLSIKKGSSRHSAYDLRRSRDSDTETHTLSVLVDNEAGVLARVVGLFSGRGYNIESLTVTEVDHSGHLSRMTIVTTGRVHVIEQIKAQLERLIPVHSVVDLTVEGQSVQREVGLLKVRRGAGGSPEISEIAREFGATEIWSGEDCLVLELTGDPVRIDQLADRLLECGLLEIARTGVVGMQVDPASLDHAAVVSTSDREAGPLS